MNARAEIPPERGTPARLLQIVKRTPGTIAIAVAILVSGAATGALWTSATKLGLIERWGWGLDAFREGRFNTIWMGLAIVPSPWMYVTVLTVLVAGAGFLEYRYGTWKMLAVTIGAHVAAVFLVALMFLALSGTHLQWVEQLSHVRDVGQSNAEFGAIGAVTAALGLLWRRRVRVIGVLFTAAMILYAGEIWAFSHAAAFAVGLALGPWAVGRSYERVRWHMGAQEVRDVAALLVAFSSLHGLLTRIWPGDGGILSFGSPSLVDDTTLVAEVGLAVINLTFAYAIHKGSRFAWWWVLVIAGLSLAATTLHGRTPAEIVAFALDLALVLTLLLGRRHFKVMGAQGGRARIWRRIVFASVGTLTFTTGAIMALDGSFTRRPTWGDAVSISVLRVFGGDTSGLQPTTKVAELLLGSISLLWYVVVAASVAGLVLNSRREDSSETAREHFIALQNASSGMTSIGYMARWEGIHHWVSDDQTTAWGFTLVGNTAIVLSDPAGDPDDVGRNYGDFTDYCRSRGWRPAYFSVSARTRDHLAGVGFKSIRVAEDTVIHLPGLAFSGKKWQAVRTAINRAEREGLTMRSVAFEHAPRALKEQLEEISTQWISDKSLPEMGFTLGDLTQANDPNVVMHLAVDDHGSVHAMTSWLPVYREGSVVGWTIDIMKRRRDEDVMPGVMEFLIAQSALSFRADGYEFVSLSCAPLSYSGETLGPVERLLDVLAERMEPYYGFAKLARFKSQFTPDHVPMYLCFQDEAQLPVIALAVLRAYFPGATAADLVRAASSRPADASTGTPSGVGPSRERVDTTR